MQYSGQAPYVVILGIFVLSGFGLPLPEDVPLLAAGYLAGTDRVNPWIMFPLCFVFIVGSDLIVYGLGKLYGHHVPRLPLLNRLLTEPRLARTERMLHEHGGKFIFFARFLPGLRTPAFFTAGTFKLPWWKFLLYDGSAALLSVPLLLGLGYAFSEHIDMVAERVRQGSYGVAGLLVLGLAVFVAVKVWISKRSKWKNAVPPGSEAGSPKSE